jgi:SHS2 domain-containing protein
VTRQIVEHTADIRLRVEGSSLAELFREAILGMYEIMRARGGSGAVARTVALDAPDTTILLVDFLNEILSRAHIAGEIFDSARFERLSATEVRAELSGLAAAEFDQDIKAVTYHEADVRESNGLWSTTLVFDI